MGCAMVLGEMPTAAAPAMGAVPAKRLRFHWPSASLTSGGTPPRTAVPTTATRFVQITGERDPRPDWREAEEFVSFYRALYADPGYAPGMDEIADLERVSRFGVHGAELREVREIVSRRYRTVPGATFRTAIIASADANYGSAGCASETPEDIAVFRDPVEAVQWLRLETPEILSLLDG